MALRFSLFKEELPRIVNGNPQATRYVDDKTFQYYNTGGNVYHFKRDENDIDRILLELVQLTL